MGVVEEVGAGVTDLRAGDRVVVPFQIACGHCFMCDQGLQTQCETTQVPNTAWAPRCSATPSSTAQFPGPGGVPAGAAGRTTGPSRSRTGPPDDRFVFLSDVLPTAWQAVEYADVPEGGTLVVLGLGPIGDMACRIARHRGAERVIGVDLVPERLARARARGVEVLDLDARDDLGRRASAS